MNLTKLADVLDAFAGYVDTVEAEKQAAEIAKHAEETKAKESIIASIGEKFSAATGEDISDDLLLKFSKTDLPILEAIEKVAESKTAAQTALGEPGDKRDFSAEPETRKEAADMADERFLSFILE